MEMDFHEPLASRYSGGIKYDGGGHPTKFPECQAWQQRDKTS